MRRRLSYVRIFEMGGNRGRECADGRHSGGRDACAANEVWRSVPALFRAPVMFGEPNLQYRAGKRERLEWSGEGGLVLPGEIVGQVG